MKRPENNKWLDDELTKAIGSEKTEPDFEKWHQSHPEAVEMLTSRAGRQTSASRRPHNIRDIIMKSPITKLAAAAVIILAVILSMTVVSNLGSPAYALEQTVKAFENVRHMHIMRRDEAGQVEDERWIEIGPDGVQARYRQDTTSRGFLVVDDRQTVLVHHKDKNTVVLYDPEDHWYTWIQNPGEFFKDLAGQDSLTIKENADYWGRKAHLVRWLKLNQDCYIDPETKLPIAMGGYEISYEDPPEGTYDVVIPEGVTVVDKRPGAKSAPEPKWLTEAEEGKKRAQRYFDDARRALAAGDYSQAAELFARVVEIQPLRNWAWFWLGKAHYELGEYDKAIYEFKKVIDMFAEFETVPHYCHLARGFAYDAKGMEDMADRDLEVALPVMIEALERIEAAGLFDYADDPLLRGGGFHEGARGRPGKEQSLAVMINRLRIITGQNFGYDSNVSAEENKQAIAAWKQWYENSGEIGFTPDADLVPIPAGVEGTSE
jgi:hypothetical protein